MRQSCILAGELSVADGDISHTYDATVHVQYYRQPTLFGFSRY